MAGQGQGTEAAEGPGEGPAVDGRWEAGPARVPQAPVLPEQTSDDVDYEVAEDDDERFLDERPPHWR